MAKATIDTPRFTVGIDLGDKKCQVCVLDQAGAVIASTTVKTSEDGIRTVLTGVERARVALEASTHSPWVTRLANELGHQVLVANPNRIPTIASNVKKTDRFDAEHLARLARSDPKLLAPIQHRKREAQRDRSLLLARNALVKARTGLVNHVRGVVKSSGARVGKCDADSFAKQALSVLPDDLKQILKGVIDTIQSLTTKIRHYDRSIKKACTRHPITERLQQITGVGPTTALGFVVTLEDPLRFSSSRAVGAYLGLVPRAAQTGDSDPELRISRAGDSFLRKLLVQAAQYVLGHFGPDTDLRRWGLKLAARGGKNAKKRAIVAVARKLAVLLHRLWITGSDYVPLREQTRAPSAA